ALLEPGQPEAIDDVRPEQLLLSESGELEDAAPAGEDPSLLVADHEPGVRRRVVVVHQLEEESEATALAGDRDVVELLDAIVVDRALLAVRADEVRHAIKVRLNPLPAPEEPELSHGREDDQPPGPGIAQ